MNKFLKFWNQHVSCLDREILPLVLVTCNFSPNHTLPQFFFFLNVCVSKSFVLVFIQLCSTKDSIFPHTKIFGMIVSPQKWGGLGPLVLLRHGKKYTYRVSQEECARLRESVPYVKVYRYNPKHLHPKLNGYGDNGQRSLKLWQLLHTYWLPNTY